MKQAISLLLDLNEQTEWGYLFRLRIVNESSQPLFIPDLEITDLHFAPIENPEPLPWYTQCLTNMGSGGTIIEPNCSKSFMFRVRPCTVDEETTRFQDDWDYKRWCVKLVQGEYHVWYDLSVDEDYFNPDSHLQYSHINKMAEEAGAILWCGSASSNMVNVYHVAQRGEPELE